MACLRSRSSRDTAVMHLLRCLVFVEAHYWCHLHPMYIDTRSNHLADDLSRNNLSSLFIQGPRSRPPPIMGITAAAGPPPGPSGRLAIDALAQSVQHYFCNGLAPSTQKTYQAAMKRFSSFCTKYNVTTPFPLTEQLLCSFAAFPAWRMRVWPHRQSSPISPQSGICRFHWVCRTPGNNPPYQH